MSDIPETPVWKVMPADHPKQTASNYINPLFIQSPNGDVIHITGCSHIHATPEQTALAKEIVTACNSFPDLLEALQDLIASDPNVAACSEDEVTFAANDMNAEEIVRTQARAILKARAAIAKATGETK